MLSECDLEEISLYIILRLHLRLKYDARNLFGYFSIMIKATNILNLNHQLFIFYFNMQLVIKLLDFIINKITYNLNSN